MNCTNWLQYANFVVQCLLFLSLIWYALETRRIRKTSQEQVETSQKPCLTLSAQSRQFENAVLEMDGVHGAQIVHAPEGMLHLINVGLGPAFNVVYEFTAANPPANIARPNGYLVHILLRESATIPVARQLIRGNKWSVKLQYDSLTGRRYETRIVIDDLVLTTVSHRTRV